MTTMPMSSSSSPMGVGRFLMTCPKIVLPEGFPSPFPLGLAAGALPRAFRSAIRQAMEAARQDMTTELEQSLQRLAGLKEMMES